MLSTLKKPSRLARSLATGLVLASAIGLATGAASAVAGNLALTIEVPRLQVAEYHRPYVAVWLENERNEATQLAVWYDVGMRDNGGLEWLKDMRQWWRRGGRTLELPIDGLSGATRAPGTHTLAFEAASEPLASLPPGDYRLRIEAAREVGGRELLEIPLVWPVQQSQTLTVSGSEELGEVSLTLNP